MGVRKAPAQPLQAGHFLDLVEQISENMSEKTRAAPASEKKGAKESPRSQPTIQPAEPQGATPVWAAAGNQAMQRLLHDGVIRARLAVSPPGDPLEREAESAAEQCGRGVPCNHSAVSCNGCKHQLIQRKPISSSDTTVRPTPSTPLIIQPKLSVSQPGDPLEQEADRAAETAVSAHTTGRCEGATCPSGGCSACHHPMAIQRKAANTAPLSRSVAGLDRAFGSGGRPLDSPVRESMETALGADFSSVRVHTDRAAAESAQSIQALAYTAGSDVVFGNGQYAPETVEGRKLLAHELAHVVQQPQGVLARSVSGAYSTIQSDLTYGVIDWAITEAECDEVLGILTTLSSADLDDTVRQMQTDGLVTRLMENISHNSQIANATLINRIRASSGSGATTGTASATATAEPQAVEATAAPSEFDPCLVDVYGLTNSGLISYFARALAVVNQGRSAPGYFDNRNLHRRLITERDRRANLGHYWLATMPDAIPQTLYRMAEGASGEFEVVEVTGATVSGTPEDISRSPLRTRTQFDRFLEDHNIERIGPNEYIRRTRPADLTPPAMLGSSLALGGLYNAPGDLPLLWGPRGAAPLAPGETVPWPMLPEVFNRPDYFLRSPGYMQTDLLQNPPAMNPEIAQQLRQMLLAYRRAPGVPPRTVNPLLVDPNAPVETGTAAVAVTDIPNLGRPNFPGASSAALPANLRGTPGTTGGSVFTPVNPTAVDHAEHVALENLRIEIDRSLALGEITRADLRGRTVFLMVEQEPCASCGSGSGMGPPGVLEQFARRYPELTLEVRNMRFPSRAYMYRSGVLLNPSREAPALPMEIGLPPEGGVESVMTPEFARTLRYGGGASGELRAMGASGMQGAGLSAFFAVATSAGTMAFDTRDHPEWGRELAVTGGLGASSGFLGSATEQLIISRGTSSMLSSVVETGASRLTPGLVTGLGRAGGGAVGAVFVEGISMGVLEEREHFAPEVSTRVVRSGLLGAGSVWAGAGIGAAAGSVVPVAGTAVGFIVGLIVGGALYAIGNMVVPGGREDWDAYEAGCHFRPAPASAEYREPAYHSCFTNDTLVTMADGTSQRIDQLHEGDAVLSYDEGDASLHPEKVLKIEGLVAPDHLKLRLAHNGKEIEVTGEHPLHTKGLWVLAKSLHVGSIVTWLDNETKEVREAEVAEITNITQPAGVYDLSVSNSHTYFAGGLLAHNKNI
jgi:hypothetical protein